LHAQPAPWLKPVSRISSSPAIGLALLSTVLALGPHYRRPPEARMAERERGMHRHFELGS
jgi:hypothetical protein